MVEAIHDMSRPGDRDDHAPLDVRGLFRDAGFEQVAVLPIEHDLMRFYRLDL